jgi:ATP-dependent exoDNAse (exonuclease V) beta subunit
MGMRLAFEGYPEMDQLGLALHKLIAAEIINPLHKDVLLTAERLFESHVVGENLDPKEVVTYAQHFITYVKNAFQPDGILAEYPVEQVLNNGQLIKGWIDVLIKTNTGWVIVDHKFTAKPESELEQEALKYSGQLMAYKNAVEAATQKKVNSCWIHFPNNGLMLQIAVAS